MQHFSYSVTKGIKLKYSIIIPTLNEEKLLPNLLKQLSSFDVKKRFSSEIIISDGGSKDNTLKIAKDHADKIIEKVGSNKQTIAAGRNAGVKQAEGDYYIFLGADIILKDCGQFFEILEKRFTNTNKYLAFTCDVKVFPEEEDSKDRFFHNILNTYFYLLNIFGVGMGRGECQVVRKDIFHKVGGYNEHLAAGEDFDLFKRIRKHGKILHARNFCVYESPRRYKKFGYLNVCKMWLINAFFVIFKNKSLDNEWEQVR